MCVNWSVCRQIITREGSGRHELIKRAERWQGRKGWVRETYFLTGIRPSGLSCSFRRVYLQCTEHTPHTCSHQFVFVSNVLVQMEKFTHVTDVHVHSHLPCLWVSMQIHMTESASLWCDDKTRSDWLHVQSSLCIPWTFGCVYMTG